MVHSLVLSGKAGLGNGRVWLDLSRAHPQVVVAGGVSAAVETGILPVGLRMHLNGSLDLNDKPGRQDAALYARRDARRY